MSSDVMFEEEENKKSPADLMRLIPAFYNERMELLNMAFHPFSSQVGGGWWRGGGGGESRQTTTEFNNTLENAQQEETTSFTTVEKLYNKSRFVSDVVPISKTPEGQKQPMTM